MSRVCIFFNSTFKNSVWDWVVCPRSKHHIWKSPNLVCRVRATRLQGWLKELCSPEPSPLLFLCLTTPPLFLQTKEGYWTFAKQRSNTVTVLHFARYVRRITTRSKAPSLPFRMSKAPETSICTATYQMYMIRTELHSTVGMCEHLKSNR